MKQWEYGRGAVIIQGMKMPESCRECFVGVFGFCYVAPPDANPKCPNDGRAEWCPMLEAWPVEP